MHKFRIHLSDRKINITTWHGRHMWYKWAIVIILIHRRKAAVQAGWHHTFIGMTNCCLILFWCCEIRVGFKAPGFILILCKRKYIFRGFRRLKKHSRQFEFVVITKWRCSIEAMWWKLYFLCKKCVFSFSFERTVVLVSVNIQHLYLHYPSM